MQSASLFAQSTVLSTTTGTFVSNNGTGTVTFNFQNSNSYAIKITGLESVSGTSITQNADLYYKTTPISGPPGNINSANGWNIAISQTFTGIANTSTTNNTTQTMISGASFVVPAGVTWGFALTTSTASAIRYHTMPAGTVTFTGGGCSIINGANVSYGGTAIAPAAPGNTPRGFVGKIIFEPLTSPYNNAAITSLVAPVLFTAGNRDIKVKLKNNGKNRIDSVDIQWKIDGVLQTPIHWTSKLDSIGGTAFPNDTTITLGNIAFTSGVGRTLVAWSEYPNNVADTVNADDTLTVVLKASLSGNFTIGGTTPDYPTFSAAVAELNAYGVNGPVTFNVAAGTFTERFTLNQVSGASAVNNIRFIGAGKTSTTITYAATSASDFATIMLYGTDHVTFRDMTIAGSNITNGVGILLSNGADSNQFRNLRIQMNTASTATTTAGIAVTGAITTPASAGLSGSYCVFDSLDIDGAYYGITMYGASTTAYMIGNNITNCNFTNQNYIGIRSYYHNRFLLSGNTISGIRAASHYALYNYYGSGYKIERNKINVSNIGMYCVNTNSYFYDNTIPTILVNNMVVAGADYGMYISGCDYLKIWHNSVLSGGATTLATVTLTSTCTFLDVRNNIFVNTNSASGNAVSIAAAATFDFLDYNDYYSAGPGLVYVSATVSYATLAAWKTAAATFNIRSYSANPLYASATDLHLQATSPLMNAFNLGVTIDIDGNTRFNPSSIGADERPRIPNNASLAMLAAPVKFCAGTQSVKVKLVNSGNNTLSSVNIAWEVDGIAQTGVYWTSPLDTFGGVGKSDTIVTLGTYSFTAGVPANIKAWTMLPNSTNDSMNFDDTVNVTVKAGMSGAYTVGSTGSYPTLTAALADLGYGVCGPVLLELMSTYSATGETFPLTVNAFAGASATNRVVIRPQAGASALNISSANTVATIDLNGAKYITIDGRPGGSGNRELTIVNTSATGNAVRFINDAQNNKLSNINITGNNTSATNGVILFSTTGATGGNSNNTIDSCYVNGNSTSANCIYSAGSAAPADNKSNVITNNNIYDYFSNVASTNVAGIALGAGNSTWSIGTAGNGNRFYQTSAKTPSSVPALTVAVNFKAIFINDASVSGCSIIGNRIGGNISSVTGSTFVLGNASTTVGLTARMIDISASTAAPATSVQGNTISDITLYTTVTNAFIGIHASGGLVHTGNITGNTIGAPTGTGSIQIFHTSTTTGANSYAIRYAAANGLIQNNIVGSMTGEVQNASGTTQILCIYASGASTSPLTISNNFVGSATTAHSVQSSAASVGGTNIMGIVASGATGALVTIANNTIYNLSSLCSLASTANGLKGVYITGASSVGTIVSGNTISKLYSESTNPGADQTSAVVGISCSSSGAGPQTISGNTIHSLSSGVTSSTAVNVMGIYYGSTTTAAINRIEKNLVHSFITPPTNALAIQNGINIGAGTTRVITSNNMVRLGFDISGSPVTAPAAISGILKSGGVASFFYNTVAIGGTGVLSTTVNTYAYKSVTSSVDSLMNNIFINTRTNGGTGGTHYAIGLSSAVNLLTNYNLYYTGTATLGVFNSTNQASLANWRTATLQDVNSVSVSASFVSNTDLHLAAPSIGNMNLAGISVAGVTTDFDAQLRPALKPYMGADENLSSPLPVKFVAFNAQANGKDVLLNWSTASEINTAHFIVEASTDGKQFVQVGKVFAKGNSSSLQHYLFKHNDAQANMNYASLIYYRLTSVDLDGTRERTEVTHVRFEKTRKTDEVLIYPNPFKNDLYVNVSAGAGTKVNMQLFDITGKLLFTQTEVTDMKDQLISLKDLNLLNPGIYFLTVDAGASQTVKKLLKQ